MTLEAHACEQLAQGCYLEADRPRFEPATFRIASERSTVKPHKSLDMLYYNYIKSYTNSHWIMVADTNKTPERDDDVDDAANDCY